MGTPNPDALQRALRSDVVLRMMAEHRVPLTRANYIALNWAGEPPMPWSAEHELELPEIFQHEQER